MTWIYDTGGHQLTTQNSLHFVSICHLHLLQKVACRILCSCVFESPQHAAAITQRHRLVASSASKKAPVFFFPQRKDLLWNYCQQKTFSSYKRYGFILYILLCFHSSPYWGLFNEEKTSFHWIAVAIVLHKNCFVLKINHLWWFSASPLYLLWTAHGLYALSSRKDVGVVKSFKNMHGYFHWFISNRAKDIKY